MIEPAKEPGCACLSSGNAAIAEFWTSLVEDRMMTLNGRCVVEVLAVAALVAAWSGAVSAEEMFDVEASARLEAMGVDVAEVESLMAENGEADQLIIPLFQQRVLEVTDPECMEQGIPTLVVAGPDNMEPWNESLFADIHECIGGNAMPVQVSADQDSSLGGQLVLAVSSTQIDHIPGPVYWDPVIHARSHVFVRFAVPYRLRYALSGVLDVKILEDYCDALSLMASSEVVLTRVAGSTVLADGLFLNGYCTDTTETKPLAFSGVLDAGVYELRVDTQVTANNYWAGYVETASAEGVHVVVLEFSPEEVQPDEADLDGDGDVDLADYALFVEVMTGPE